MDIINDKTIGSCLFKSLQCGRNGLRNDRPVNFHITHNDSPLRRFGHQFSFWLFYIYSIYFPMLGIGNKKQGPRRAQWGLIGFIVSGIKRRQRSD